MKRSIAAICLLLLALGSAAPAMAGAWPRLVGGEDLAVCRQALAIADATFNSESYSLSNAPTLPAGLGVAFALRPRPPGAPPAAEGEDDDLIADPALFERFPDDRPFRSATFRQIEAHEGFRWVVTENRTNSADSFDLFAIPDAVTQTVFRAGDGLGSKANGEDFNGQYGSAPLMARDRASGEIFAIVIGPSADGFGSWSVLTLGVGGARRPCVVQMFPEPATPTYADLKSLVSAGPAGRLPAPVRRLIVELFGVIGPDPEMGTLYENSALKQESAAAWANVALRPWALTSTPYNSREEIAAGLLDWSRQDRVSRARYRALLVQYPAAENALAAYYRRAFRLPHEEARQAATFATDFGWRSAFTFHSDRPHGPDAPAGETTPDPWPAGVR